MKIIEFFLLVKKCIGEARWNPQYRSLKEKWSLFKTLFSLRYYTEIRKREDKVVTLKIFGFTVTGSSYYELLYLFREIFIEPQYDFQFDGEAPTIIDCGANIGMATLFFKKKFPLCKILAFEPNPEVFTLLKKNVADNKLKDVEIVNAGLSNEEGTIDFYVDVKNSLISSIERNRGEGKPIKINLNRLSKVIEGKKFDFAKVDIEGAEWKVITDLDQSNVIQNIKQYAFEYHHNIPEAGFQLSSFLNVFEKNGYKYNLKTSYEMPGDFQDISIRFFKKNSGLPSL